jgi:AcrR family transcriptional regulator
MSGNPIGRPKTIDPEAVSLTALRLFDDRGYDAVSMDDVAAAAGVSRRYLFRLFPSKASLVWGGLDEFIGRLRASLAASPATVPALKALTVAYEEAAAFPDEVIEITRHRLRVIAEYPALASEGASRVAELTNEMTVFVLAREGRTTLDLETEVRASALAATSSAALTWWALHSDERPEQVVARAVRLLAEPLF